MYNGYTITSAILNGTLLSKMMVNGTDTLAATVVETDAPVIWLDGADFTNSPPTTSWIDKSGRGNNATPINMTYTTTDGSDGIGGVVVDGVTSTSYLEIADTSDLAFGINDFTIHFYIKRLTKGGTVSQNIFGKNATGNQNTMSVAMYFSSGNLLKGKIGNGTYTAFDLNSSTFFSDLTRWYHIAMVRSGNSLFLFKDGVLESTKDVTGITVFTNTAKLLIGRISEIGVFAGSSSIDDFKIYKGTALWTAAFTPPTRTN